MPDHVPAEVLERLFAVLPPQLAATIACVCVAWASAVRSSDVLWRHWARQRWDWWPAGVLGPAAGAAAGASTGDVRRLVQARVAEERRCDQLLLLVAGAETEAAQRELIEGGPYTLHHMRERARPGGEELALGYFARRLARRQVVDDTCRRMVSLAEAATAAAPLGGEWLERGALLVERCAKHGAAAMARAAPLDHAAADADEAYVREQLASFAEAVRARLPESPPPLSVVRAACAVLFTAEGADLCGDEEGYYTAENSYLSEVLRRKKGIPITLCALLAALCSRVGVTLAPVSFPMTFHLMLPADRDHGPPEPMYIDAFGGGVLKSREEMVAWLQAQGVDGEISENFFRPCAVTEIWTRMLRNLIGLAQQGASRFLDAAQDSAQTPRKLRLLNALMTMTADPQHQPLLLSSQLRLAAEAGELAEWIDMATAVLGDAQEGDGLPRGVGACRQHLQQVTRRLRGYEPPPGSSEKAIEAEWVAVYGGGAQAVAARERAAAEGWVAAMPVGSLMEHKKYGYRGVVVGADPSCLASEQWKQQMGVGNLEHGAEQPFCHVLVDSRDRAGDQTTYVAQENLRAANCAEWVEGSASDPRMAFRWRRAGSGDQPAEPSLEPEPEPEPDAGPAGPAEVELSEIEWWDRATAGEGGAVHSVWKAGQPIQHAELGRYFERLRRTDGGFAYVPVAPLRSFYPGP